MQYQRSGRRTHTLSCDCNGCTTPLKACVGNPYMNGGNGLSGEEVFNCGKAKCVSCKIVGEECQEDGDCCSVYRYKGHNAVFNYNAFCDKKSKICASCAPNNEVCGTTKAAIPCCDKILNKDSKVTCQQSDETTWRCTSNICSNQKNPGFTCPSSEGRFCKCGTKKNNYKQCIGGSYVKCNFEGGACKADEDCCSLVDPKKVHVLEGTRGAECIDGKCSNCIVLFGKDCGEGKPPCCHYVEDSERDPLTCRPTQFGPHCDF